MFTLLLLPLSASLTASKHLPIILIRRHLLQKMNAQQECSIYVRVILQRAAVIAAELFMIIITGRV